VADESLCHIYYRKQQTVYELDTATGTATELCQLDGLQELEYALDGYLLYRSKSDSADSAWTHCAMDLTTLEVQEYLEDPEGYSSWVLCSGNSTVYMVNRRNQEVMDVMIDAWDLTTGAVTHLVPERPISETPSTGILVGDELYYITSTGVMYSVSISAPGERETHLFTDLGVCNESLLTQCGDDLYITGFYDGATTIYRYDPDADQVTAVGRFEDGVVKSFVTDGSRYGAACRSGVDYHTVWGDLATEVPLDGEA
jgi:hypothetical protein